MNSSRAACPYSGCTGSSSQQQSALKHWKLFQSWVFWRPLLPKVAVFSLCPQVVFLPIASSFLDALSLWYFQDALDIFPSTLAILPQVLTLDPPHFLNTKAWENSKALCSVLFSILYFSGTDFIQSHAQNTVNELMVPNV